MFFEEAFGEIRLETPNVEIANDGNDAMAIVVEGLEKILSELKTHSNPKKANGFLQNP